MTTQLEYDREQMIADVSRLASEITGRTLHSSENEIRKALPSKMTRWGREK